MCELEGLEALFLDDNGLDGAIPDCFGLLRSMRQLYLFKNKLSGEVPVELASLRQLCKFFPFRMTLVVLLLIVVSSLVSSLNLSWHGSRGKQYYRSSTG